MGAQGLSGGTKSATGSLLAGDPLKGGTRWAESSDRRRCGHQRPERRPREREDMASSKVTIRILDIVGPVG
jgi:hypothetical protein